MRSIGEGRHGVAGPDHPHVFNIAQMLSCAGSNMLRPPPSGFATCTAEGQSADLNDFKFSVVEDANFDTESLDLKARTSCLPVE